MIHAPYIVITNSGAPNVGDYAILLGQLSALRSALGPDVRVTVIDRHPAKGRFLDPQLDWAPALSALSASGFRRSFAWIRMRWALALARRFPRLAKLAMTGAERAYIARLQSADAVVSCGGTYLVEHYSMRSRALEIAAAAAMGKPIVLYTQSLGPFRRRANIRLLRWALRGVARVYVRDERSGQHLVDIGFPAERIACCADAAFTLAAPRQTSAPDVRARRRLAISVRAWTHFETVDRRQGVEGYRRSVAAVVRAFVETGWDVVFMSTCQGVPDYGDDSVFAQELVDELLSDIAANLRVDHTYRHPHDLISAYGEFSLVLAMRMHAAILALCARTPVVALAYERKSIELMDDLGMPDLAVDVEGVTPAILVDAVARAAGNLAELRRRIEIAVDRMRTSSMLPAHELRELLAVRPSVDAHRGISGPRASVYAEPSEASSMA